MRTLFHMWLSPFCRKVRIVLHDKELNFQMKTESVWEQRSEFLALNPVGEVPVMVEENGQAISGSDAICEFLAHRTFLAQRNEMLCLCRHSGRQQLIKC